MFRNYLKIAFRNIVRHRAYSFINIAGLAIGMASSILILLWVQNELSYDRFHANAGQTYRITVAASEDFKAATNPAGMPAGLQAEMPEIRNTVRLSHIGTHLFAVGEQHAAGQGEGGRNAAGQGAEGRNAAGQGAGAAGAGGAGERKFEEKRVFYADSTFLQVFSFPLVKGDAKTALQRPNGVLITEDLAKKYFGGEDALGKTLTIDNGDLVTVTGVLANVPDNSHLQFDVILPMSAVEQSDDELRNSVWNRFNFYSYVQLDRSFVPTPAALARLGAEMTRIYQQHVPPTVLKAVFQLEPLTSIHLDPSLQVDLGGHGNIQYVHIFFIVAIFILVVACINFMNLATARSARRAKEVGLRKVVGALRGQLIKQFLGEAMLISLIALLLALLMVWLFLPVFNGLAEKQLALRLDLSMVGMLLGIALATGLIAGSYPALYLSGFQPVKVLKGNQGNRWLRTSAEQGTTLWAKFMKSLGGNLLFRNGLVVTQFVVSIVLLVGTVVIYRQLQFIKHRSPGFEKANVLYVPFNSDLYGKVDALQTELRRNRLTEHYALVSELPINLISGNVDGQWEGKDPNSQVVIPSMKVSEGFIDVFHMTILHGRGFGLAFKGDSSNFVINETAVKLMGMTVANAVGKPLSFNGRKGMIVGVVKDFNFKPIQQAIEPLVLMLNQFGGNLVVRAEPGTTEATIKALEKICKELSPTYPFSYDFLDQRLASQYKGEQQMGSIFNLFAVLAILISSLGLYGLSAFLAQQRTKEIGVRKVLGASVFNIIYLLSGGFTRLILVAVVIAVPVSYVAIHRWLDSFAYHIQVGWVVFAVAAVAALVIAWGTVSYESLKAAVMNPAKSLRSE